MGFVNLQLYTNYIQLYIYNIHGYGYGPVFICLPTLSLCASFGEDGPLSKIRRLEVDNCNDFLHFKVHIITISSCNFWISKCLQPQLFV